VSLRSEPPCEFHAFLVCEPRSGYPFSPTGLDSMVVSEGSPVLLFSLPPPSLLLPGRDFRTGAWPPSDPHPLDFRPPVMSTPSLSREHGYTTPEPWPLNHPFSLRKGGGGSFWTANLPIFPPKGTSFQSGFGERQERLLFFISRSFVRLVPLAAMISLSPRDSLA